MLISSPEQRVEMLEAGAFDCLLKPISASETAALSRRALEYRRLRRAEREKQLLEGMMEAGAALAGCQNREQALACILTAVQSVGLERVRIYLESECPHCFVEAAHIGMDEGGIGRKLNFASEAETSTLVADPRPRVFRNDGHGSAPRVVEDFEGEEGHERACIPLVTSTKLVGVITADNRPSGVPIRVEDLRLLKPFSALAAAALEAVQAAEEIRRKAEQLEAVRRTTLAITASSDRDTLLRTIIEQAVDLLQAGGGGIYEFDSERNELTVIVDHNRSQHVGKTINVEEGLAGWLVRNGETFKIVDDYNEWPGRAAVYDGERPYGAVVEVLLKWRQEGIVGVLYVDDRVGRKFTEEDARLLSLFADQAALALVNAELAARDERRKRLEKLPKATKEMMSNLGRLRLDERLTIIGRYATEILEAEVCGVHLVKRPGFLTLEASHGHKDKGFEKGKMLPIRTGPGAGLTGHIAFEGQLFNKHGSDLVNHFAVSRRGSGQKHLPSGECYSLLAMPLKKTVGGGEELIGLLRVENKKGKDGLAHPSLKFEKIDEWILSIFTEAVVVAIESAGLVAELNERKEFHARLVSSSPNGIVAVDRRGRITLFNECAEQLLGHKADDVNGRHVSVLHIDPREYRKIRKELQRSPTGRLSDYHLDAKSKGEELIPVCLSATWLYDSDGNRAGLVGYFEDLRTIQKTQQQLGFLLKASATLAHAKDLDEGLRSFVRMMAPHLPHSFCRILLISEDKERLEVKEVEAGDLTAGSGDALPVKLQLWQPLDLTGWPGLGELLDRGMTEHLVRSDARSLPILERLSRWLCLDAGIQSLLVIPLKLENRVVGLLEFGELRPEAERPFTEEEINIASAIAAKVTVLIDRMRLHELTKRRRLLLEALNEASFHIHSTDRDPNRLLQEVVRLAAQLVGCTVGGLYVNQPYLERLELMVTFGLPDKLEKRRLAYGEGLIGRVVQTGEMLVLQNYSDLPERETTFDPFALKTLVAIPLKQETGEVEAVLFVANTSGQQLPGCDIQVLNWFAAQAAVALQTSRLLTQEQRISSKLSTHIEISNYFQGVRDKYKMLHAVLTGVTANYGLLFNRAALFLLNKQEDVLEGQLGVGHLTEQEARQDWISEIEHGTGNFANYRERLEQKSLPPTPLNERIKGLRLRLDDGSAQSFAKAVRSRKFLRVETHEFDTLPSEFKEAFCPSSQVIIVPLVVGQRVLGVLVADNKFTRAPVTEDDINFLLTFTNTAAIAIDNHKLLVETREGMKKLRSLFNASMALISSDDAQDVLQDIVEKAPAAADASWVRIILIDDSHGAWRQFTGGTDKSLELKEAARANGISAKVMRTGKPVVIEDTERERERLNPLLLEQGVGAALCFPFTPRGKTIGVMWINYDAPRHFRKLELNALQLYVKQAAIAYDRARRVEELQRLHDAAKAVSRAFNLAQDNQTVVQRVLRTIVDEAARMFQADFSAVWPYDHLRERFLPDEVMAAGIPEEKLEELRGAKPRPGGLTHTIMKRGSVAIVDMSAPDSAGDFLKDEIRLRLLENGVRSLHGVALKAGDELLGALYVSYAQPRTFGEDERQPLENFASYASLSIKNARLLDQVTRANRAAEVVARVTALHVNRVTALSLIAHGTQDAVGCDAVVLFAYDPKEDKWNYPPACSGVDHPERARSQFEIVRPSIIYDILEGDKPYEVVEDVTADDRFRDRRFAREERIESLMAIPLQVMSDRVGVMFVNYRKRHRFTADDLSNIQLFANQAAVAVRNAQLYDERAERLREQASLVDLSKALLGTINPQETLDSAVRIAADILGTEFCEIVLPDEHGVLTKSAAVGWDKELVGKLKLEGGIGSQTGYTVMTGSSVITHDYKEERRFHVPPVVHEYGIMSGMSVPIYIDGKAIGAMLVHSKTPRRFGETDMKLFSLIAYPTAIAINSARRHEELLKVQRELAQQHTLAWMGVAGSTWAHDVTIKALVFKENAESLLKLIRAENLHERMEAEKGRAVEQLQLITEQAQEILDMPITMPFYKKPIPVNDLLRERVTKLCGQRGGGVRPEWRFGLDDADAVQVSKEWFSKGALDIIIINALEAMADSPDKVLTVASTAQDGLAEISICDTGPGVPFDVREKLFAEPITSTKGAGIGLFLASKIVRTFGGYIRLGKTDAEGTTMIISLPLTSRG